MASNIDEWLLKTQQWLNRTYGADSRFDKVPEDGITRAATVYGLLHALQIELGIEQTADAFGPGTQSRFVARWPGGIRQQADGATGESNVYAIIQGALWCKGYGAYESDDITRHFYGPTGKAIRALKVDMGIGGDSTVTMEIMMALLSMQQFKLIAGSGGKQVIREVQQQINEQYRSYTGIIPTDGLYGREMNTALIQVLQALEGFTPDEATGNFGNGTRSRLKTINASTAGANPKWVWLASAALVCNGYGSVVYSTWNTVISGAIDEFQNEYALPVSQSVDAYTWMSLLTSCGNPNRPAKACDTRFEITDEFAEQLKADGYEIVGRYLTEPGQESLNPADYFKAIRPGELERIVKHGLKYFPIFQEYSTKLTHFTPENGKRHAREAVKAAQRLGIPQTVIYFAVDYDATDPEVTAAIMPYFKAVHENMLGGYKVGIYASRNICARVCEAGYAVSSFVSDMSTGFSGNLGFPIPTNWNYDQFTEISGYHGKWDLDRVAYSGRVSAVASVLGSGSESPLIGDTIDKSTNYSGMNLISLIWHLEKRFDDLRAEGKVGKDIVASGGAGSQVTFVDVPTYRAVLNYMAKYYLRDGNYRGVVKWSVSAESYRDSDAKVLEQDYWAKQIIAELDSYLAEGREEFSDISGGRVDLAHLAATCLGYFNGVLIPDRWAGWAGDLATGAKNVQLICQLNPTANTDTVARALIGAKDDWYTVEPLASMHLDGVHNECNYSDMCSDGDAVYLTGKLKAATPTTHLLSDTMLVYYNNRSELANRFKQMAWSMNATSKAAAEQAFYATLSGTGDATWIDSAIFDQLGGSVDETYLRAASCALAEFIF